MPITTAARRERDLRRREDLILDAAEDLLLAHGYLGLNLDRLAERVEYSKGTLYNHFETKEDIVLTLASRSLAERVRLFERAAAFPGRTRERVVAISVANEVLAGGGSSPFQIMQMAKTPSLWEKTTVERRAEYGWREQRCIEVVEGIVRAAVAAGDVVLTPAQGREFCFGLMALSLGTYLVISAPGWTENLGVEAPLTVLRANQHRLLDGAGWRPLLSEWDYAATEARIRAEAFPSRGVSRRRAAGPTGDVTGSQIISDRHEP